MSISSFSLIIANLVPLIGVLFFDWSLFPIMILYWFETAVIGFFNVIKMLKVGGVQGFSFGLFFIFHFSIFMLVHLIFIIVVFGQIGFGPLAEPLKKLSDGLLITILPPFLMMFASHAVSFFANFIYKGEWKRANVSLLFTAPYGRIAIMHLTIIVGGLASLILHQPIWSLVLLVILKTLIDLFVHVREHPQKAN
ncbi:MAG: DUF6498-containing protein [Candidatus Vogelbacteria bacterium]